MMEGDLRPVLFPVSGFLIRNPVKEDDIKGVVIAGTSSRCGKTVITLGLLGALVNRGLDVRSFKIGPDFLDILHHQAITGKPARNLDGWMLSEGYNRSCFQSGSRKADIAVVEGVMGLFDGFDGKSEFGSTAQMAKWLELPVILVVDAKYMVRSAAALVRGFESFDPELLICGVIFNNVGSRRHFKYLEESLENNVQTPCLGGVARYAALRMPERGLGRGDARNLFLTDKTIEALSRLISDNIDIYSLLDRIPNYRPKNISEPLPSPPEKTSVRMAVAKDRAFCFFYQDNLEILKSCGAEIVFFSPLRDKSIPEGVDGVLIGGGFPELFGKELEENESMRNDLRQKGEEGLPIYSECGGFMYLCENIVDISKKSFHMVGCFPLEVSMLPRLTSLGYRRVTIVSDSPVGKPEEVLNGHEFRCSEIKEKSDNYSRVYEVSTSAGSQQWKEGYQRRNILGSNIHIHFGSRPGSLERFVRTCLLNKQKKSK